MSNIKSDYLAIMLVDICGYTDMVARMSREEISKLQQTFKDLVTGAISSHGGTIVKNIGDAYLLTFKSSTDALKSGVEIQASLSSLNKEFPEKAFYIKIAINTGEVVVKEDGADIFGDSVNLVARLEKVAGKNEIVFTEATRLSMTKGEVPYEYTGTKRFKGIADKISLYRVGRKKRSLIYKWVWRGSTAGSIILIAVVLSLYLPRIHHQLTEITTQLGEPPPPADTSQGLSQIYRTPEVAKAPEREPPIPTPSNDASSPAPGPAPSLSTPAPPKKGRVKISIPRMNSAVEQKRYADDLPPGDKKMAAYRAVVEYYPASIDARWSKAAEAKTLIDLGRVSEGQEVLWEMSQKVPVEDWGLHAEIHYLIGESHLAKKEYEKAKTEFQTVIQKFPGAGGQVDRATKAMSLIPSKDTLKDTLKAFASSQEDAFPAEMAVDGRRNTRWSSAWSDNQWLIIQFDKPRTLNGVSIFWETAIAREYSIDVSMNKVDWQTVADISSGRAEYDKKINFSGPLTAKFLRVNCKKRATEWGVSIWEITFF